VPCGGQVGHLNELQEKYQSKGLSILAVTSEGASETEKWVASKGAKYPYAYDKGGKLARHFGVRGIPHAVLVDASGTVAWKGHPGGLDDATLSAALRGALPKPLWEWSAAAKGVKTALQKRAFKSALDQAAKLKEADGGPEILAVVQGMVKASVDGLRASFEKGDFLGAQTTAQALQKELAGLAEVAEAAKVLASIAGDKNAQNVIKGQQKLAKIRAGDNSSRKDIVAAIDAARKIRQDYGGTFVEKEADELIVQLNERVKDE
jgi:thioredoxin-like negative regulator of GroEL